MALSITTVYHFVGCCYAECRNLFVLSVDMLNVIMLSVVTPHYLLWVSSKKKKSWPQGAIIKMCAHMEENVMIRLLSRDGATTLRIMTLSKTTFSINDPRQNNALPSCWVSYFVYYYAEFHYAECRILSIIMLNFIMLNVVMLNVVLLCVVAPLETRTGKNVTSML